MTPRNIAATAAPVHISDRTISYSAYLETGSAGELQNFIFEFSTLKALKLCSQRFHCNRRLCPWCSRRIAARARRDLRRTISQSASGLYAVLSTESKQSLDEAWNDLLAARREFAKGSWLSSKSTSWIRQSEITHTAAGWHAHDNWILVGTPANVKEELVSRWLEAANRAGTRATPQGQYAATVRSIPAVIHYSTKGIMVPSKTPDDGMTAGDLLTRFQYGDADAAELWQELESFFQSRHPRFVARGGALRSTRRQTATAATRRPRGAIYSLADLLPLHGLSKAQQAAALGCSERTIATLRAELRARTGTP